MKFKLMSTDGGSFMLAAAKSKICGSSLGRKAVKKVEPLPPEYADDIDLQLMARVKAGDDEAFNQLMQRHEKTVVNLVYRFTGNREIASDLAQEVFLRIYRPRAASRLKPSSSPTFIRSP